MRTQLPLPQYEKVDTRQAFYTRVLAEVRALPGVSQAAYVSVAAHGDGRRHLAGLA